MKAPTTVEKDTKNNTLAPSEPSQEPPFQLILRDRTDRREHGREFTGPSIAKLVLDAVDADVDAFDDPILDWTQEGHERLTCVDIDVPEDGTLLPSHAAVDRYFPRTLPQPLVAFRSHHGGLKAIFVECGELSAVQLAGAWVLLAPLGGMREWRIELKADCRHPKSERVDSDGSVVRCGPVRVEEPSARIRVPFGDDATVVSDDMIGDWLATRGLEYGRYSTEACPLPGCTQREATSGADPVVISTHGLRCHRCDRFTSWDAVIGGLR